MVFYIRFHGDTGGSGSDRFAKTVAIINLQVYKPLLLRISCREGRDFRISRDVVQSIKKPLFSDMTVPANTQVIKMRVVA